MWRVLLTVGGTPSNLVWLVGGEDLGEVSSVSLDCGCFRRVGSGWSKGAGGPE